MNLKFKFAYMSSCWTSKGGGGGERESPPPFTPLKGEDFVNSKIASYFHQLGRFIAIKMLIKPLFIFNQQ